MRHAPLLTYFEGPLSPDEATTWTGTVELALLWINEGGAGTGLTLQVWGPAVDTGLVELRTAAIQHGSELVDVAVTSGVSASGERVLGADAPQAAIGAAADWDAPGTGAPDIGASMLKTRLQLQVLTAGRGWLSIGVLTPNSPDAAPLDLDLTTHT